MIDNFPDYNSIKKYVDSNFKLAYNCDLLLENYFVKNNSDYLKSFNHIFEIEPIYFKWKSYKFPVFIHQNETVLFNNNGQISFDIFLNAFLFLSGWQEIICNEKDSHGRFPYKKSLQHQHSFSKIPVVNIYFELIYETVLKNKILITQNKFKPNIISTHDIDQLRSGWFENIQFHKKQFSINSLKCIISNIYSKVFGLKDEYLKGMERMLALDEKNNIEAISFFIPKKSHKDADFDLTKNKFLNVLKKAKKKPNYWYSSRL